MLKYIDSLLSQACPRPGRGQAAAERAGRPGWTRNLALITLIVLLSQVLGGCGWIGGNPDDRVLFGRTPDPLESQYFNLGAWLGSEKPCYLISHKSVSASPGVGGFLGGDGRIASYLRSDCFSRVANVTERPELCEHVRTVSTLLYRGHKLDRDKCIEEAIRAPGTLGAGYFDGRELFELIGWTEEHIDALLQKHGLAPDGTYCLLFSREFFEAIERLPNFATEADLAKARTVEWRPHMLLTLPGYRCTGKFL